MDRRMFLGAAGLGVLAPKLPAWLKAGFQEAGGERHCPNPFVRSTLERARALGKPTLVFVVPERGEDSSDPEERSAIEERWARQTLFGQYLNYCSEEGLLDLALCEVLCARQSDVAVHVPEAVDAESPLLLLVDPVAGVRAAADDLPELPNRDAWGWGPDRDRHLEDLRKSVRGRVRGLERSLNRLLHEQDLERGAVARYASLAVERLGDDVIDAVEAARLGRSELEPRVADDAAAIVLRSADASTNEGRHLLARLADGARFRLRTGPPFGATWARSGGCGSENEAIPDDHPAAGIEPELLPQLAISCGMGHVPEVSRRFLDFWGEARGD